LSDTPNQETTLKKLKPMAGRKKPASVRTSPGGYFAVASIMTFAALVCLRTQRDLLALILVSSTWTVVPLLILTDRLSFNGTTLRRSGFSALMRQLFRRHPLRMAVADIERVEVASLRTLRRGGNVRYRYRVEISGNDSTVSFASGGRQFRRMMQALLPCIPEYKLDARACELRDHLVDARAARLEAERLGIAPALVLENVAEAAEKRIERQRREQKHAVSEQELDRATLLRRAGNDLRIIGSLQQSAEAFRRALLISPRNAWMIYEYARLLKSQASAFGDASLLGRACAALRLSAMRGRNDARLLERVAESFLEYCDAGRAAKTFRRALEVDEDAFRAHLGLAEVALGDGKLAHVIHHYNDAARCAPDKASARLARREADYYSRLHSDEDYLAAELRRMNWLEGAGRIQRLTARVSFAALLMALIGSSVDQVVAGLGWAMACSSIIAWSGSLITRKFLSSRGRAAASDV